jgi:transglutaminase-like putative cysteine protease
MKLKTGCLLEYYSSQETPLILLLKLFKGTSHTLIYEELTTQPVVSMTEYTDIYGNSCHRMLAPIGKFSINTTAIVETAEYADVNFEANFTLIQDLPDDTILYLLPSRFCESDKLNPKAFEIIKDLWVGYEMVEAIRLWVHQNIKYEYDRSTSSTSALDTLSLGLGVCRDLSHLAIALCRSLNIPARFVVGYVYMLHPMDLHAWFEAYLDGKWYTFDATQAVVTGGRVVLAYGRDAADVATATYFGDMRLENMNVFVEKVEA